MAEDYLEIRGARVHNLKDIDVRLPHHKLNVVTGVSGSGKSSLAFDIIYAEGQRRYVESLSSYARQFLERMAKPLVDDVAGIAPTVAVRQKNSTNNPRSTVATVTEIHDFLRLLFARIGQTHCMHCDRPVESDAVDAVTDKVLAAKPDSRWYVLFPVQRKRADFEALLYDERYSGYDTPLKARLAQLREHGYSRLYQRGRIFEFSSPESLVDLDLKKLIHVLADRIAIAPDIRERVADAVEIAYRESAEVIFQDPDRPKNRMRFSSRFECSHCDVEYQRPEPRMFTANSHTGMCTECHDGLVDTYSMARFVSRRELSLKDGAVDPLENPRHVLDRRRMLEEAEQQGVPLDVPYRDLSRKHRKLVEDGGPGTTGLHGFIRRLEYKRGSRKVAEQLEQWRARDDCPECLGSKLPRKPLCIRIDGESIADVLRFTLGEALEFFEALELDGAQAAVAANPLAEIRSRLRFLVDVGLEYLTLHRKASTLSGGESQRIQLASSLGSRLVGVCYVLDEPSVGLHTRDTAKLIGILEQLRDIGNTIVVVEHDIDIIRAADHLTDLGPAAGEHGGKVLYSGSYDKIGSSNGSVTGRFLRGRERIEVPAERRKPRRSGWVRFEGARANNLQDIDVRIPKGLLTVISGVSGSGKTTLLESVILPSLGGASEAYEFRYGELQPQGCRKVSGASEIRRASFIGQAALDRSSRSVTATYIQVFDRVRQLFAATEAAARASLYASHFSFNAGPGACLDCAGTGVQLFDMQFLADVEMPCEACAGKRYRREVLAVTYKGKSIWNVLELTVTEALAFFGETAPIVRRLAVLDDVGLGYLRLGQSTTEFSGGEAQRLKLAQHLAEGSARNTMILCDEPTTGLHFADIRKLLSTFDKLIERGATVVVIEHNLDVIKSADWVIDLGPEGGARGGRVVGEGPPELIARSKLSHTGRYLRELLQ